MQRKNIIIITAIVIALAVLAFIGGIFLSGSGSKGTVVAPTISPSTKPNTPAISYNEKGQQKLAQLIEKEPQLDEYDVTIKEDLSTRPNPLFTNENIEINYDQATDSVKVKIHTIRTVTAKNEAVGWLRGQGLSGQAICTMPVAFDIDPEVAENLRGLNIVFNPLPLGC